jgi:DNA (cytosine-5)-methyltransferase 1
MLHPSEMIVDLFAGGGGASVGIFRATGRHPDLAVNHDATAIAVHTANHPTTRHAQASVWRVEPREACAGRTVGLLWASPDCRHFSRASGGAARWPKVRTLPGVVITWATRVRPRVIVVENVQEMQGWGPLLPNGQPCPDRVGRSFKAWVGRLRGLGYQVEWRSLCAADFGAPTTRTRMFVVARCDGVTIRWPAATHGRAPSMYERPWRTAAECIDWSLPCPSIFTRTRPLAPATLRRIAAGVDRFVLRSARPFIMGITHHGGFRGRGMDEAMPTITCANRGEHALVAPTLVQVGHGEREGQAPRVPGLHKPLGVVTTTGAHHALVAACLTGCGGRAGQSPPKSVASPMNVITTKAAQILVAAFLAQHNGGMVGTEAGRPLSTVTTTGTQQQLVAATLAPAEADRAAQVAAFLVQYNGTAIGQPLDEPLGTVTTRERFAIVQVQGVPHVITDIGMRMLHWRELAAAQGLPDDYAWTDAQGAPLGKTKIIRLIGNSVSPPPAEALLRALLAPVESQRSAA